MHEHCQIALRAMRDASHQPWDTAVTTAAKFSAELRPWSLPNSERSAYISNMASILLWSSCTNGQMTDESHAAAAAYLDALCVLDVLVFQLVTLEHGLCGLWLNINAIGERGQQRNACIR